MLIFVLTSIKEHFPTQGPRNQMTIQGFKVERLRYKKYTLFSSGVFVCQVVGFCWSEEFSSQKISEQTEGVSSQLISFGYKS